LLLEIAPEGHDAQLDFPVPPWYLPAVQDAQELCPVLPWYLPAAQSEQPSALPVPALYLPVPQFLQELDACCEVASPYLPFPHSVQLTFPVLPWYLPFWHDLQLDFPVCSWYLPFPQAEQPSALPLPPLYLPVPQFLQELDAVCVS